MIVLESHHLGRIIKMKNDKKSFLEKQHEARKTKIKTNSDGKIISLQVMTRKIARNIARKNLKSNKGIGPVVREIYVTKPNNDLNEIKKRRFQSMQDKKKNLINKK